MNEKQLKDIFKGQFDFDRWRSVLEFVFGKVEVFARQQHVFDDNNKVKSGKQYGLIKLSDDKSIAIFDVEVADDINIERNRQGLRDIAAKYIDQNITHGAIVFYHSKKQSNYRFSFIAKWSDIDLDSGELQKGETQKKRFTYLLGEQQSGATAAKRLLELANKKTSISIKDVTYAFSVEVLTKEFFKKYKDHHERFWRYINEHSAYSKLFVDKNIDDQNLQKTIRDFAKKMLGRIVFLHFLQKKGWLGCPVLTGKMQNEEVWVDGDTNFMCNLFENYAHQDEFYSECLTELFYNTLNKPDRKNNVFSVTGTRVPYLNGGLFDSDQPGTEKINFPKEYFGDLFDFFSQYNFTIDENSPDEQEVGIDPEMLGHIFENLLEENREKGAFYTPKEIVQYMCQESLMQYLNSHLPQEAATDQFIRNQQVSKYLRTRENALQLNTLLNNVKVCDPAIGSGAFPIGILQEIYKAKMHIFPYLKTMENFDHGETKKKIIENSIYGVDLEHGAVEIARLRFWLALVVDEDRPQPLPNLDYKIMQGDSLLESFEGIDLSMVGSNQKDIRIVQPERDLFGNAIEGQMKMTFTRSETVQEIQSLIGEYFNEKKPNIKAKKKNEIDQKVHDHIDYNLELREQQLIRRIAEAGPKAKLKNKDILRIESMEKELASFKNKRALLHRIQNTEVKPYFIWHLFFKDVFDNGGFDIVIGNPPYIQLQKESGKLAHLYESQNFETFERTGDIYSLFYEKGAQLLKSNGLLCYITSNKWMRTNYGASTRKFFAEKTSPLILIDFGNVAVFETATVDSNILLLKKGSKHTGHSNDELFAVRLDNNFNLYNQSLADSVKINGYYITSLNENSWVVGEKDIFDIKGIVERQGTELYKKDIWKLEINYGIKTGFNEAFIISQEDKEKLVEEDKNSFKLLKRILRGKDIEAWYPRYADLWLIGTFPSLDLEIDEYPAIKKYLLKIGRERLEQNGTGRKKTGNKWFETQDQISYWKDFEKPKIIYPNMTKYLPFVYDENEHFFSNDKSFIMVGERLKYLTCFFNSKLFKYCFISNFPELGGTRFELRKVFFDKIPVKPITSQQEIPFSKMLEYTIALKRDMSKNSSDDFILIYFEQVVNALIYELYFEPEFVSNNIEVAKHIRELPSLDSNSENKISQIRKFFVEINRQEHPVRQAIFTMVSIPQIQLIQDTITI